MEYLGLIIITDKQMIEIPKDKLQDAQKRLQTLIQSKKTTKAELDWLVGVLSFLSQAVTPSRAFLSRLRNLANLLTERHHHARVTVEADNDAKICSLFLSDYKGQTDFLTVWQSTEELGFKGQRTTDALYIHHHGT